MSSGNDSSSSSGSSSNYMSIASAVQSQHAEGNDQQPQRQQEEKLKRKHPKLLPRKVHKMSLVMRKKPPCYVAFERSHATSHNQCQQNDYKVQTLFEESILDLSKELCNAVEQAEASIGMLRKQEVEYSEVKAQIEYFMEELRKLREELSGLDFEQQQQQQQQQMAAKEADIAAYEAFLIQQMRLAESLEVELNVAREQARRDGKAVEELTGRFREFRESVEFCHQRMLEVEQLLRTGIDAYKKFFGPQEQEHKLYGQHPNPKHTASSSTSPWPSTKSVTSLGLKPSSKTTRDLIQHSGQSMGQAPNVQSSAGGGFIPSMVQNPLFAPVADPFQDGWHDMPAASTAQYTQGSRTPLYQSGTSFTAPRANPLPGPRGGMGHASGVGSDTSDMTDEGSSDDSSHGASDASWETVWEFGAPVGASADSLCNGESLASMAEESGSHPRQDQRKQKGYEPPHRKVQMLQQQIQRQQQQQPPPQPPPQQQQQQELYSSSMQIYHSFQQPQQQQQQQQVQQQEQPSCPSFQQGMQPRNVSEIRQVEMQLTKLHTEVSNAEKLAQSLDARYQRSLQIKQQQQQLQQHQPRRGQQQPSLPLSQFSSEQQQIAKAVKELKMQLNALHAKILKVKRHARLQNPFKEQREQAQGLKAEAKKQLRLIGELQHQLKKLTLQKQQQQNVVQSLGTPDLLLAEIKQQKSLVTDLNAKHVEAQRKAKSLNSSPEQLEQYRADVARLKAVLQKEVCLLKQLKERRKL